MSKFVDHISDAFSKFKAKVQQNVLLRILLNKYTIFTLLVLVYLLFFTKNSILNYFKISSDINDLEKDRLMYENIIKQSDQKRLELQSDKDSLEKFAREHYMYLEDGEDIYIVTKENKNGKNE